MKYIIQLNNITSASTYCYKIDGKWAGTKCESNSDTTIWIKSSLIGDIINDHITERRHVTEITSNHYNVVVTIRLA